jgi:hypothetical protein
MKFFERMLTHINTGSVDTETNWRADARAGGWDFDRAVADESLTDTTERPDWAVEWVEAEGGYMAFESADDAEQWQRQV